MKKVSILAVSLLTLSFLFFGCEDPSKPKTREQRIAEMVENIKNNPEWLGSLKKEAEEKKTNLDSVIIGNARFMIEKEDGKLAAQNGAPATPKKPRAERVAEVEKEIRSNPEWLATIKEKAEKGKVSLDSAIRDNAVFKVDEEDGKHK